MPKTTVVPMVLPSRMKILPDGLNGLEVAVLDFPFMAAINTFKADIANVLPQLKGKITPPLRELNNALLACAPTLTYGFEKVGWDTRANLPIWQMLAVGTKENLHYPSAAQIADRIIDWGKWWTGSYRNKNAEANQVCDEFLDALMALPANFEWKRISPQVLIENLSAEHGLGYKAIPSLLATLLHGKTSSIHGQEVEWRRAQGSDDSKSGLFVLSKPFKAHYVDWSGHTKEGYFTYRIDFSVQTQAGRFNASGNLEPWIFINVSCQRYGDKALGKNNFGRKISIFTALKRERLLGFPIDSTLVRLQVEYRKGWQWTENLSELLAEFKAESLPNPAPILDTPYAYSDLDNTGTFRDDEYYIVHAEGYKYRNANHAVKTGYSFAERADVVAAVLAHLGDILKPDIPLEPDEVAPFGVTAPHTMHTFNDFVPTVYIDPAKRARLETDEAIQDEKERLTRANSAKYLLVVSKAVERAVRGDDVEIVIIHRDPQTFDLLRSTMQDVFLLNATEPLPPNITVRELYVKDGALFGPLDRGGLKKPLGYIPPEFTELMRQEHRKKCDAWLKFFKENLQPTRKVRFAIIVLPDNDKATKYHTAQSIKGAVREACAREGIASQFVREANKKSANSTDFGPDVKGRVRNAVCEIVLRHTGALFGTPSEVYRKAGLPETIADSMEVIALCRQRSTTTGVHYALAVRLRASGEVDVLLPENGSTWLPYYKVGPIVGLLFAQERNGNGKRQYKESRVALSDQQLSAFARRVLTEELDRPTLAVVEATYWRNAGTEEKAIWPQLSNPHLHKKKDVLILGPLNTHEREFRRDNPQMNNLLAVIRLRRGDETPQYITDTATWQTNAQMRDIPHLTGYIDQSVPDLLHYFSIAGISGTQRTQDAKKNRNLYKIEADIAYKHQQLIEFVPFFVHPDLHDKPLQIALCRAVSCLRTSPAWTMGNINLPYPMHLGETLIEDQQDILRL